MLNGPNLMHLRNALTDLQVSLRDDHVAPNEIAARLRELAQQVHPIPTEHIDIVFQRRPDWTQGPELEFIEVEDEKQRSVRVGEWLDRADGYRVLRIPRHVSVVRFEPKVKFQVTESMIEKAAIVISGAGPDGFYEHPYTDDDRRRYRVLASEALGVVRGS